MPEPTYQELVDLVASQAELIEKLTAMVAELERRLGADSSNSSRPPSSDSPCTKKVAKARSSRQRSGRKPGKQPGDPGVSMVTTAEWTDLDDIPDTPAHRGCAGRPGFAGADRTPRVGDVRVPDLRTLPARRTGHAVAGNVDRAAPGHRVHRPGPPPCREEAAGH